MNRVEVRVWRREKAAGVGWQRETWLKKVEESYEKLWNTITTNVGLKAVYLPFYYRSFISVKTYIGNLSVSFSGGKKSKNST